MLYEYHDWDNMEWETISNISEGFKRKVVGTDEATLVMNHIEPNIEFPVHHHPHKQIMYVISGDGELLLENESKRLGTGGFVIIEPNAPHGYRTMGEGTTIMLDIFIPRRPEYEEQYKKAVARDQAD